MFLRKLELRIKVVDEVDRTKTDRCKDSPTRTPSDTRRHGLKYHANVLRRKKPRDVEEEGLGEFPRLFRS